MSDMHPWVPMSNPTDIKHLGKLGEEAGELCSAVSRCLIQGIDGIEPTTGKSNRIWLEEEMADVLASIYLVGERFYLSYPAIVARAAEKQARLRAWHGMPPG